MPATVPLARYATFFAEQEQPELAPNEVAYWLSGLTGIDHYAVHQALAAANPMLFDHPEGVKLDPEGLASVAPHLGGYVSDTNS